jgi:hypothetical protein
LVIVAVALTFAVFAGSEVPDWVQDDQEIFGCEETNTCP